MNIIELPKIKITIQNSQVAGCRFEKKRRIIT